MGSVPETAVGFPGYTSIVPKSAGTVFEILKQNGWGTSWFGKTHLTPLYEISSAGPFDRWPNGMGAEYFYGFFGAGVSQWYPPLWENTTPMRADKTPEEGYHLENDMTNKAISWIERQKSIHPDKPWFTYFAPNGHKPPVGVPDEWIKKYRGKFDDGYDKLRERILARQIALGIVPPNTKLAPMPKSIPAWDKLSDADKKVGARWMEVFCGAVEYYDYQVGRIIEAVRQSGELDNTLIIYIAGDNGPTPEGGLHGSMNKLSYFNGVPESLDDLVKHIDDFGGTEVARQLSRGLGLRNLHALHIRQRDRIRRRQQHGDGHVMAGTHQGPGRQATAVSSPHRHCPDHSGERRCAAADADQRSRSEADGRRQHDVHLCRCECQGPAHDAVFRAVRRPCHISRRLVGRDASRRGRRDRCPWRHTFRQGRLGTLRHEDRFRPGQRPGGQEPGEGQGTASAL